MKKLVLLIFFLILINVGMICVKTYSGKVKKIDIHLKDEEIAITFLPLSGSNSLLVKTQEFYILYVFQYLEEDDLEKVLSIFTNQIDYVFMREEYPLSYSYKMLLDEMVIIQDIQLEPNRIHYRNQTFCLNETAGCDYVYLTEEIPITDEVKAIFYDESLSEEYIQSLHKKWSDFYKITKDSYTILLLNKGYEVLHLED